MKNITLAAAMLFIAIGPGFAATAAVAEYSGQFETALVPNIEDHERLIFKSDTGERLKGAGPFSASAHFAAGKLLDPRTQQYSIWAYLVEEKGKEPVIFVDTNEDRQISADEKFVLKRRPEDTYIWHTTATLKVKEGFFKTFPIFVQYYKSVTMDKMGRDDRLIEQSTEVLARGTVNVKGKNVLVQYAYDSAEKKVDPQTGWLGIDADENGEIDMDNLSPEAAKANEETVVFRLGSIYLSTKKADVASNQIVLREHEAKDYKRVELYLNQEFPDFGFTDFDGSKRRFSEFRGKWVLLDVWGWWCGPCRAELPYIREASQRFRSRNLHVVGLNTDRDHTVENLKKSANDNQMTWANAQYKSVAEFLNSNLRVSSFPTTFLISPEGKIISMSRSDRDEPDLRGRDLLTTLDEILPKP